MKLLSALSTTVVVGNMSLLQIHGLRLRQDMATLEANLEQLTKTNFTPLSMMAVGESMLQTLM